jgi:hypothetical protein
MEKKDKKEEKMAPHHEAKRNVLSHLSNMMKRHMGAGIKDHMSMPKKAVTVEAPDAKGLKAGLDLASKLAPSMDQMSKAAKGMMGHEEEPRDMDEAAMEHEEESNEMPMDKAELMAEHDDQDEDSSEAMKELKKHLSKKA